MKILLMGNPNVGKSAFFSRLTGVHVVTFDYPGTTVEFIEGKMHLKEKDVKIINVPGVYTLEPISKTEEVACKILQEGDAIINVVDSTNLGRSLNLTLQLIKKKIPLVLALNLWDEAKHTGIKIDIEKLQQILGVPCVSTCAISGEGFKELTSKILSAKISKYEYEEKEKWHEIGNIIDEVETITHRHHTFKEQLADASIFPTTGILMAIIVLFATFQVIRFIGEGLIKYALRPFFENLWAPLMLRISGLIGSHGFIHDVLIGKLTDGKIDFEGSFGLLTTGLFVPIGAVFPYVFAFYLILSFLEDSGYLPRLAILVDNIMHRLGLHGMAIIPMILGLGCNVSGALSTRIMESERERFIVATLMSVTIPCMVQTAMLFGLMGKHGAVGLGVVFATLFVVWIILGVLLNKVIKGESREIFLEIPPYRFPCFSLLAKKVWMRIIWFVKEAVPWVMVGVFIVNMLYYFEIINLISKYTAPLVSGVLGLPREAVGALFLGIFRKDVAVGMLIPLQLTFSQLVVASVVLIMYFPCVTTFITLVRELGIMAMLKSAAIMIVSALLVGGILNIILSS